MVGAVELRHLRYFVAVAGEENVSRAALKLHVSQPALSRQVRDLEEELGFDLLERGAKSVGLTEAGRVFFREVVAVLERLEEGVEKARAVATGGSGELHIGYAPSLTPNILPKAMRAYQMERGGVKVLLHDLSSTEMLERVRNGSLHLALMVRPQKVSLRGLCYEELMVSPWCVAVSLEHRLAKAKWVRLEEVVEEPLIGYQRGEYPDYMEQMGVIFGSLKGRVMLAEEHDGVTSLIAAVESGAGVSVVPETLSCIAGGRVKLVPVEPAPEPVSIGAVWVKEGLIPSANRFLQLAIEVSALSRPD